MTRPATTRRHWLLAVDPRIYHWDTLFVKGKEMFRHAGNRPSSLRQVKLMRRGDRILCYHGKPDHSLYAIAEVTRDPYPDPLDSEGKRQVIDLRAVERLPRQVTLVEMRENRVLRKVKFLKNPRLVVTPVADEEYSEILRMAGIVAAPGIPLP